jgi:hypothetical protein
MSWILPALMAFAPFAWALEGEYVPPATTTHGVDMRMAKPQPSYEYDLTYIPSSLDARIEGEIQDRQTTDFVVEQSWTDIRRQIMHLPQRAGKR